MLLPTCPKMLQAFQNISDDAVLSEHLTNVEEGEERTDQFVIDVV